MIVETAFPAVLSGAERCQQTSAATSPMTDPAAPVFALSTSRGFPAWLGSLGASLAFTTYQAGKLLFLGLKPDGTLS
jgi:hypothetical protein